MQLQTVLFSALILLITRSLYFTLRERQKARNLGCKPVRRYPHSLPFGLDLHRKRAEALKAGRYNKLFVEHFQANGPTWEESVLGNRVINTMDTENFRTIGALNFWDYSKNGPRQKVVRPMSGRGIFSLDGAEWQHSRNLIKPLFKRAELTDVKSFEKFVDRMIALVPRDGSTIDLQPLFSKLFLDNSSEFIFGKSLNCLVDTSGESEVFLDAFNKSVREMGRRANFFNGKLNFLFMFDTTWEKNYSKIHAFIDQHVVRTLAELDSDQEDISAKRRQRYVLIDEMAKQIRDPIQLRFELINIFLPARDTTAIAVSNTFFMLARNPGVWAELRKQALALGDTPLTYEVVQGLSFFRYTFFEGIRMQGPAPRLTRIAVRDTVLPRGGGPGASDPVFVPKGTIVAVNIFPKFRDPEVWGEDVDDFRPSRFEGRSFNWDFTPFFGGPRICPASQQVISQAVYLLVRLAKEFERLENRDECEEFVENMNVFAESRTGVKVALHVANWQ